MKNKLKMILMIVGIIILLYGAFTRLEMSNLMDSMVHASPFIMMGFLLISISMILYSKELKSENLKLAIKGLAFLWLVSSGLYIIGAVLIRIFLKFWIFM